MSSLLWLLLGLFLGFVIGTLAPNRDSSFISVIQKRLKKGQIFTLSVSHFDMDDDEDDGDDFGRPPLIPRGRYKSN